LPKSIKHLAFLCSCSSLCKGMSFPLSSWQNTVRSQPGVIPLNSPGSFPWPHRAWFSSEHLSCYVFMALSKLAGFHCNSLLPVSFWRQGPGLSLNLCCVFVSRAVMGTQNICCKGWKVLIFKSKQHKFYNIINVRI
jgi:hypothetical protein